MIYAMRESGKQSSAPSFDSNPLREAFRENRRHLRETEQIAKEKLELLHLEAVEGTHSAACPPRPIAQTVIQAEETASASTAWIQ